MKATVDVDRFLEVYGRRQSPAERAVEREVFGVSEGVWSYTTPRQADLLARRLELRPGVRVLDVGAGRGWPALYLARKSGCQIVATDVPEPGLRTAFGRARGRRMRGRCAFAMAAGTHLPFRARSFDAVIHSDTL